MGMFDKDKEYGTQLTSIFDKNEEFIVWGARVDPQPVSTEIGDASKTRISVARIATPDERFEVTTLASAIAEKAREAESSDFPAVCVWTTVHSAKFGTEATVLQYVRPYAGEHTRNVNRDAANRSTAQRSADEEIPF